MTFGALLRRLRIAAGLSQEALAERARISAKAVGSLEVGTRRAPYRETVEQLLMALDASPEDRLQLTALAQAARTRKPRAAKTTGEAVQTEDLPFPATRLIGRAREVAAAAALLANHRLLTLVGAGGVGKTRVAIELARGEGLRFCDGRRFVDLAALSDPCAVISTVAAALGISSRVAPTVDSVAEFLQQRRALVILDNCEHVLDGAAHLARAVLRRSGESCILATSREPLRTDGEAVFEIPVLDCPPPDAVLTPDLAMRYSAVELFCERASSRDAGFALGEDDCQVVARIVRRLDGLPLAIELAAARVRALGLATVESRLSRRFDLLSDGNRAAPSRQQTMYALIAWSYDLLLPCEQLLLRRLSVFAGGWSLEAAEAVCGDEDVAVLPSLASLVEKSLVASDVRERTARYTLLESTRDFARDALGAAEGDALAFRHARWVCGVLRKAEERIDTEGASTRLVPLFADLENIRAALQWCDAAGEFALGGEIASRIPELFYWYGLAEEGCKWLERSLERVREDDDLGVAARLRAGVARLSSDANTRLNAAERGVDLARRSGDARLSATAYMRYAVALYTSGRLNDALAANDRARALLRRVPTAPNLPFAWALQHRSWILVELRRFDEARACIEEAIRIFTLRNAEREAWGLSGDLAELEFAAGRAERALEIVDEAIPVAAQTGDPERESVFICNRAGYLLALGDFTEAEATAREAVVLAVKTHGAERVLHALEHLAAALACRNDVEPAAMLAGFVQGGYSSSGYERETTERSSHEILAAALRATLPPIDVDALMRRGAEMTQLQAVELAARTVPVNCRS
ncbi:MAG: helix-turn-helix domain-containing protein [Candidatus Eremiobacteraeota bacterium]|nr:helix-turn-helix domain-containing protein [Candidatus Eremiobacteraeota bacterium]